jgi:uncharacterized protein YqgC (DUF456 family)
MRVCLFRHADVGAKPQYATSRAWTSAPGTVDGRTTWHPELTEGRGPHDVEDHVDEFFIGLLMAIGLVGVIMPFLPGLPIIWGAALLYGFLTDFGALGWTAMTAITLLGALGIAASYVIPERAGAASGASRSTRLLAGVTGVVGFFVIPIIGFPIGACAGVLLAQYRQTADFNEATRATVNVLKGFGIGMVAELGTGLVMVLVWAAWAVLD